MADFALGLQGKGRFIGPAGLEMVVVGEALGVHQVEVEILHAAGLELGLKQRADVRLALEKTVGELVGEGKTVPGVAAGQALPQGQLALALEVAVGYGGIIRTSGE